MGVESFADADRVATLPPRVPANSAAELLALGGGAETGARSEAAGEAAAGEAVAGAAAVGAAAAAVAAAAAGERAPSRSRLLSDHAVAELVQAAVEERTALLTRIYQARACELERSPDPEHLTLNARGADGAAWTALPGLCLTVA